AILPLLCLKCAFSRFKRLFVTILRVRIGGLQHDTAPSMQLRLLTLSFRLSLVPDIVLRITLGLFRQTQVRARHVFKFVFKCAVYFSPRFSNKLRAPQQILIPPPITASPLSSDTSMCHLTYSSNKSP